MIDAGHDQLERRVDAIERWQSEVDLDRGKIALALEVGGKALERLATTADTLEATLARVTDDLERRRKTREHVTRWATGIAGGIATAGGIAALAFLAEALST